MGKVRAVANGNILDESEVAASLIEAGIYVRVDESEESTKVEPLTTESVSPMTPEKPVARTGPSRTGRQKGT